MEGQIRRTIVLKPIYFEKQREERIETPILTEYLHSGKAIILIFIVQGVRIVISFYILFTISEYLEVPSDNTQVS